LKPFIFDGVIEIDWNAQYYSNTVHGIVANAAMLTARDGFAFAAFPSESTSLQ
jgi:hypothetical protein